MAIGDSTRINTNIAAFNALNALKSVNRNLEKSQLKLATGLRINGVSSVGTTKNVLSITEEGLLSISFILIMMKELVTQTASDTLGTDERNAIKSEIDELSSEVGDIVSETQFNGIALVNYRHIVPDR